MAWLGSAWLVLASVWFRLTGLVLFGLVRVGFGWVCLFAIDVIDFRYMGSIPKHRRFNFVVSRVLFVARMWPASGGRAGEGRGNS